MNILYNKIGINYANLRQADPRIANAIWAKLGNTQTILNVGAGTGSYEPIDKDVTAIEPSLEMIKQRPKTSATIIQGFAENLPFADKSFDASMAILTVHHWKDKAQGMQEILRVTKGAIVFVTFDPDFRGQWLTDYLPELISLDAAQMPKIDDYRNWLGEIEISPLLVPYDCTDGFLYSYWRRPTAYLDVRIRAGSSAFWAMKSVNEGVAKLESDIESGKWAETYGHFLEMKECDLGYRLIVANQTHSQ